MSSASETDTTVDDASGGEPAPQALSADFIPTKNLGFAFGGVAAFGLGILVWLITNPGTVGPGLWVAIGLWSIAVLLGLYSVAAGSSQARGKQETAYNILVPITFNSPVLIALAIQIAAGVFSAEKFLAVIVAVSVFVVVMLTALLKSNVSGVRRDALELSLISVGLVGAIATAVGVVAAK